MSKNNRRNFLKSAGATAAMGLFIKTAGAASPNETINVGVVGLRGRGKSHLDGFSSLNGVEVIAMCDVDERILNDRVEDYKDKVRTPVKKFTDFREMIEDQEIDAVTIATPNHWHSIMTIWACQAGKDVYVEKPGSHNIYEGRKMVEAARKYNRIVQHGTQIRSSKAIQEAMKMLHDGVIGEVYYAKGTCYKWRNTIGNEPVEEPPEGVHYNLWLGPAPKRPFTDNRFHYDWHWHWDYGNGDIGNQGVHQMDVARWGLGVGHPDTATALGGHFMFEDDQETPNTMEASFKYKDENKMMQFSVRHWITNQELGEEPGGNVVGNMFLGSKGMMVIPSYSSYRVYLGKDLKPGPKGSEGGNHWQNFIDAVRKRDRSILTAEIEEGHISSALCHLANAAYMTETHIQFDRKTERCTNSEEADAILQGKDRGYRTPFDIPEEV